MNEFTTEEGLRTIDILIDPDGLNLKSRQQFIRIFDNGCDGRCLDGIDEVRGHIFKKLWAMTDEEWVIVTGLPVDAAPEVWVPET